MVARMRIILTRRERGLARKAAQDEHPRIVRKHRRQAAAARNACYSAFGHARNRTA
jgi:hypothetical protein